MPPTSVPTNAGTSAAVPSSCATTPPTAAPAQLPINAKQTTATILRSAEGAFNAADDFQIDLTGSSVAMVTYDFTNDVLTFS